MKTENQTYADPEKNKEYYSKSDKNFMSLAMSLYAHRYLDRVAWVRDNVHELGSQFHLDIGTKDGYLPLTLTAEGIDCVGVDPSSDAIEEARLKAREAKYDVKYIVGYLDDIEPKFKYDTVSMLEVIEHVIDPEATVERLARLGRYVMISTPDYYGRHGWEDSKQNDEHLRIYTKEELEELCSKYGRIVESVIRDDQLCILFESNL
jgi:2-polyprenyl-3-methyl-5-hydroxy-6-metoxy-1,4-benzoquinol methylase